MINNYEFVFFDLDGVLLSSTKYYAILTKRVAEELGAPVDIPYIDYHKMVGAPISEALFKIVPEHNRDKIKDLFRKYNKDRVDPSYITVIEGAEELLIYLKNKSKKTAIISTKNREALNLALNTLNWQKYFDYSVAGCEVVNYKPDPEGLNKTLSYFGISEDKPIFIGDSVHDLNAARNADIDFLGVLTGVNDEEDWKKENAQYIESVKKLMI